MDAVSPDRIVIVGGGITGLAAAWELRDLPHRTPDPVEVVVLEGSPAVGGKLRSAEVGGHPIDVGAESMLARRPEAVGLLAEAGLTDRVVHPTGVPAAVWSRGRRWPLPPRTLMGVPSETAPAAGLLDESELARLRDEELTPPVEGDVSVGDFVAARLGPAVVDRLVEPLLAGVYAGHARLLSLRATVPALWPAAAAGTSIVAAARRAADAGQAVSGPVFAGYRGGLGSLVGDLRDRLVEHGVVIRTGATVRALERHATGWSLTVGPTTAPELVTADAVVLAVPAAPTSRLLAELAPRAATALAAVDYASVALVSYAVPRSEAGALVGSGFLVPPSEPGTIKASTFSAAKWEWVGALDPDVVHLRVSFGRAGETAVLQRSDDELAALGVDDLERVLGARLHPVDAQVQRWGGGLPQYAVGHLDRVAAVRHDVDRLAGLEVAGAAYDGVGIPACIGSGRRAAQAVATHLRAATHA